MSKTRLLSLLLFAVLGMTVNAQENPIREWKFQFFQEWKTVGDTVLGKSDERNNHYFFVENTPLISIEGTDYHVAYHHGEPISIETDETKKIRNTTSDEREWWYSIGIRRVNGRVLTNYEDFKYYQSYHLIHDYYRFPLHSFGNPDYLPYNLTEDGKELILYDYTMEVGDSYRHVDGYDDISVAKKDTIWLSGDPDTPRRRLTLTNGLVLIEGVGCINSNGMLIDYLNPETQYASRYTYLVQCTTHTGDVIYYDYRKDSGMNIFDQNTLGITEPSFQHSSFSATQYYDLQGRRLKGEPQRGIYIKDGKKVARK